MAAPNDRNQHLNRGRTTPPWRHPEVQYWQPEWAKLRDSLLGEVEIKRKGEVYLPRPEGVTDDEYLAYLDRAPFVNMVARTLTAMIGTLFRRPITVENLPDKLKEIKTFGRYGETLPQMVKNTAQEVILVGRHGVLVDLPSNGGQNARPYFASYIAENILDWTVSEVGDSMRLTEVILREVSIADRNSVGAARTYRASYRRLYLDEENGRPVYRQAYYAAGERGHADITGNPTATITPTIRGKSLEEIPFMFFGSWSNGPDVERSPMLDIATLNLSHYKSYAHLEHGRYYTGLPVYYAPVDQVDSTDYQVGPSHVWEVPINSKPGILEFNGQGLRFLENALTEKEKHIANLGGRIMGGSAEGAAESDNQAQMKERNEAAILLNISLALDEGYNKLIYWYARWRDVPEEAASKIEISVNKDFLLSTHGAREFRAIHALYTDGILPIEVVYEYLRRAEVIPDWMRLDEFKKMLKRKSSFPNNPDYQARKDGFPDRKTQLDYENEQQQASAANAAAETALRAMEDQDGVTPAAGEPEQNQQGNEEQ